MARLFGFSIDSDQKPPSVMSPVPQTNEDGVDHYIASGFYGQYVDIEGVYRTCLLYTSPSPRDRTRSRMPSSA